MEQYVAGHATHDVVGTHDAAVEDDAVVVVADEVDQVEQYENLGKRVYEQGTQCAFVENPIECHEKDVHEAKVAHDDNPFQQLVEL